MLVLGGGIAGIAAALDLCAAGARVSLIESRDRLGGRASSFFDAKSGLWLDNCQHVTLGCCDAYLRLCAMLGASELIRWDDEQYWVEEGGRTSLLKPAALPPPLHGFPSFMRAKFLSLGEKARVAAGLAQIQFLNRHHHESRTFSDLLEELGQSDSERRKFWDPIIISACNLTPQRVSALPAIQVFQQAFLAGARPSRIGIMTVPLGQIYERARSAIADSGGAVLLGESVSHFDGSSASLASGHTLEADAVVCALPFEKAILFADDKLKSRDPRFDAMSRMTHSPILGVHLFFDRPMLKTPHAVLVGGETQWLFRKDESGRMVHAVISAADEWMALDQDEIVARVLRDVLLRYPEAADARLELARPVKERRATFAFTPGFESLRPDATGPLASSPVLAGDYTKTDWPATMEGAARSGFGAAQAVRQRLRF